jgi:hypothetical protein
MAQSETMDLENVIEGGLESVAEMLEVTYAHANLLPK